MTFKLRVPGDGVGHKSISSHEQYSDNKRPFWNKGEIPVMKPKEFTIIPDSGTIRAQGFAAIRVKCTAFQDVAQQLNPQRAVGTTSQVSSVCPGSWEGAPLIHMEKWAWKKRNHCGKRKQMQMYWAKELTLLQWISINLDAWPSPEQCILAISSEKIALYR